MATKKAKIEVAPGVEASVPTLFGLPVIGNFLQKNPKGLEDIEFLLLCDEYGQVERVVSQFRHGTLEQVYKLCPSNFDMGDKGCFCVYGVHRSGGVLCAIAVYPGDVCANNPIERQKHVNITTTERVNPNL